MIWFFEYYIPKKSIATTRTCGMFGPWAVRAVGWRHADVFLVASEVDISGHEWVHFGHVGGNDGHAGVQHKFSTWSCGGIFPNM